MRVNGNSGAKTWPGNKKGAPKGAFRNQKFHALQAESALMRRMRRETLRAAVFL